jgi:hypothetical protein
MCIKVSGQPCRLVLTRYRARNGKIIEVYTYAFGKVTNLRNGKHKSMRNFTYPIGQTVHDPNAKVGDVVGSSLQTSIIPTSGSHSPHHAVGNRQPVMSLSFACPALPCGTRSGKWHSRQHRKETEQWLTNQ